MWYFPRPLVHESIFLFRVWWNTNRWKANRTRTSVPRQPRLASKENSTLWFFCLYALSSYFISPAARQRLYGSSIYDKDFTALLSTAVETARETPKTSLLLGSIFKEGLPGRTIPHLAVTSNYEKKQKNTSLNVETQIRDQLFHTKRWIIYRGNWLVCAAEQNRRWLVHFYPFYQILSWISPSCC